MNYFSQRIFSYPILEIDKVGWLLSCLVGSWQLAVGSWQLAVGSWQLEK
jgi:hypothetical protein